MALTFGIGWSSCWRWRGSRPLSALCGLVDGTSTFSCGWGAWPPDLSEQVAALYLQGRYDGVDCSLDRFSSDGTTVEINELKMLHEILHTLSLVSWGAPHHTLRGHTSDNPTDLMYGGPLPWEPSVLDVGHDDYYLTGRPTSRT